MSKKLINLVNAHYILLGRSFVVILGCIAVCWGIIVVPNFWHESSIESIAGLVIAGDQFKPEILTRQLSNKDSFESAAYCRPAALRSIAVIRLRIADEPLSTNNQEIIDTRLREASNSVQDSLSCSPADPYLWLALYWLASRRSDFKQDDLKYLRLSYQLGPNEGWIASKRNHLIFESFDRLPPDLANEAIDEFVKLVDSSFYPDAVVILTGPAWKMRDLILPRLKNVAERHRKEFAKALYAKGYDVAVPGVEHPDRH
jgi:hypothetical protein